MNITIQTSGEICISGSNSVDTLFRMIFNILDSFGKQIKNKEKICNMLERLGPLTQAMCTIVIQGKLFPQEPQFTSYFFRVGMGNKLALGAFEFQFSKTLLHTAFNYLMKPLYEYKSLKKPLVGCAKWKVNSVEPFEYTATTVNVTLKCNFGFQFPLVGWKYGPFETRLQIDLLNPGALVLDVRIGVKVCLVQNFGLLNSARAKVEQAVSQTVQKKINRKMSKYFPMDLTRLIPALMKKQKIRAASHIQQINSDGDAISIVFDQ